MEEHHLVTRKVDKKNTVLLCRECHRQIHVLWADSDLRNRALGLDTIEGLREQPELQKALRFIRKVPPGSTTTVRESKRKRGH